MTHFRKLATALADAQYEDKHDVCNTSSEMTVDAWFEFWITNLIADLAPNTRQKLPGTVSKEHPACYRKYALM